MLFVFFGKKKITDVFDRFRPEPQSSCILVETCNSPLHLWRTFCNWLCFFTSLHSNCSPINESSSPTWETPNFCEGPFDRTDEPAACARITMDLAGANGDAWMNKIYFAKALLHTHTHTRQGVRLPAIDMAVNMILYGTPSETMQYLGWDSLFCKFCIPIWRIRNFDPCPAQGSWTTLAAEFVLGPKRRGKKLMNIFLGQGKFEDVKRSISCRTVLFTEKRLNQIQIHQLRLSFPKIIITESQWVPHPPIPRFCVFPLKGTPLHSMARWASRLDDLSHVLAWGRCVLAPFWGVKDHGNPDQKSGWKDESVTHKRTKGMRLFLGCGWDKMIGWGNNF